MTWPPPSRFRLGDFVIAHDGAHRDLPAVILEVRHDEALVGGYIAGCGLWEAWFPNWRLIHDIHALPEAA